MGALVCQLSADVLAVYLVLAMEFVHAFSIAPMATGQQVVEEILDAQRAGCPVEYNNIKIPKCHYLYDRNCTGGKEMPFVRSRFDKSTGQAPGYPRQQVC